MRVHSITVMQMHDEIGVYTTLVDIAHEYDGVIVTCKKGRDQMDANMKADAAAAAANRAKHDEQYGITKNLQGQEIASTAPGSLSPAATAQLAGDRDNINRVYSGIRQNTEATLGNRGFGTAPSGFRVAAENGINQGQATAETGAYRNAVLGTERQRQHVMDLSAGLTGTEGSLGTGNSRASETAAVDRNHAGSTFGDIMGGVAAITPYALAPFTGGASLLGANGNIFKKKGSSGVGGYAPSDNSSGVG